MMQNYMNMMAMNNQANMFENLGGYEDWMKGYNLAMSEENNKQTNNQSKDKKNCIFTTTQGVITNVPVDSNKTMSELIMIYLKRVGKPELFNKKNGVCFLANGKKIPFTCQTKVKDYFPGSNIKIIVNDINNLIGA